jgi:hypothetical protein
MSEEETGAPLRRHHLARRHRKVDDGVRAQPGRVQGRRSMPPSPRSRKPSRLFGQGQGVNTLVRKGKDQALPRPLGYASDVKKAIVTLAEGQSIDIDVTTGLSETKKMALKTYNPDAGPRQLVTGRPFGAVEGQAGQGADRRQRQVGRSQQHGRITARHRGGGHKRRTASSTSSATSWDMPARSSGWNTIRTAPPSSR